MEMEKTIEATIKSMQPIRNSWFLYKERIWLLFMLKHHKDMIAHFTKLLKEIDTRIEIWENYLRTGK